MSNLFTNFGPNGRRQPIPCRVIPWKLSFLLALFLLAGTALAREKDATQYGVGLILNVPYPESQVTQVVRDVVQNGIIRGTKEYNKDEYVSGANAVDSTPVFKPWAEGGRVFYKVRNRALDPRNFKNGGDVGTLAVRYVIQPQGDKNSIIRIDAIFVEEFRHVSHLSNGSVESAEYKDIHDRLEAMAAMKAQAEEEEKQKQRRAETQFNASVLNDATTSSVAPSSTTEPATTQPATPPAQPQTLAQHVQDLRRQVERLVKAPGAPVKSAPFHTASTLESLPAGTEVLIVVSTTYWFGVETHDGHHGWMLRDDLEMLP
jgi:hypothetical protein